MCTIGLVSIGNPRLIEYSIWIIDAMYGDAFMTEEDEEATIAATAEVSALDGTGEIGRTILEICRKIKKIKQQKRLLTKVLIMAQILKATRVRVSRKAPPVLVLATIRHNRG